MAINEKPNKNESYDHSESDLPESDQKELPQNLTDKKDGEIEEDGNVSFLEKVDTSRNIDLPKPKTSDVRDFLGRFIGLKSVGL